MVSTIYPLQTTVVVYLKKIGTIFDLFSTVGGFDREGAWHRAFYIKQLVENMGGTIEVSSIMEKHTTFKFRLKGNLFFIILKPLH
jgi:signal transduction histidine kinase